MSLLKDRLFALLCLLFSTASVIAAFIGTAACAIVSAVLVLFIITAFIFLKKLPLLKTVIPCLAVICIGLLLFSMRVDYRRSLPSDYNGKDVNVTASVYDVSHFTGGGYGVYLNTIEIDGKRRKARIYYSDFSGDSAPIPGDTVTIYGMLCSIEDKYYSDKDYAVGCFCEIVSENGLSVIGHRNTVRYYAYTLRSEFCEIITENTNEESGGLLCALLLNDRTNLPDRLPLEFRRLGISHLLSLSGLHLTVLTFGLCFILKKLRTPKSAILIISVIFIVLYTVLTGAPYSILRAAVMTFTVCLAWFSSRQSDPLTALLFATALIIAIEPGAIYDRGFWLSVSATFGLIAGTMVQKRRTKPLTKLSKVFTMILTPLLLTLYASLGTLPFTCFFFGEFAVLSPIANVIFTPLFDLMLWASMILLLLSPIPYLGNAVGSIITCFCEFVIWLCGFCSDRFGYTASLTYIPVIVLICLCTAAFLFFLLLGKSKIKKALGVVSFSLCFVLILCTGICNAMSNADIAVTYFRAEYNDFLILNSGSNIIMIDSSSGTSSCMRSAVSELSSLHITEIDTLVLTHYGNTFSNGLRNLFSAKKIHNINLPLPKTEKQKLSALKIENLADTYGIKVGYYEINQACVEDDTFNIELIYEITGPSSYIHTGVLIQYDESKIILIGASYMTAEYSVSLSPYISDADYILIGSYPHRTYSEIYIPVLSEKNKELFFSDTSLPVSLSPSAESLIDGIRVTRGKKIFNIKISY